MTTRAGVETLVQVDPAGDVNAFGTPQQSLELAALDLRKVVLKRDSRYLHVTLRTAARPHGSMTHTFAVLQDRGVRQLTLRVDWDYAQAPQGHLSGPGLRSRPVKISTTGVSVSARLPLNRFTRASVFKWQAWTALAGQEGEITDTVPNRYGNYGFFPTPTRLRRPAERGSRPGANAGPRCLGGRASLAALAGGPSSC